MSKRMHPVWVRYGLAVIAILVAAGLRLLLDPVLGNLFPFTTLFYAILFVAWFGGFGPALVATLAGGVAASLMMLHLRPDVLPDGMENQAGLLLYLLVGLGISLLGGSMQRAWRRAEAHTAELELENRQRRQTEHELSQSQHRLAEQREKLQITLKSIGDAVITTDPDGKLTFLNPMAQKLTGWTPQEAVGASLVDVFKIIHEHTRLPVTSPVEQVLRARESVGPTSHTVLIARDGTEYSIDESASPIRDDAGSLLGVVLVFRDATRRRALEIEQGRLAALVDSSHEAILGQTFTGILTHWNPAAERLFGWTAEEVLGRSIFSSLVPPERKDELLEALQRVAQGEQLQPFDTCRVRKDGRRLPISVRISPIRDARGRIVAASAIDRDISQQEAAGRRRNARLAVTQVLASGAREDSAIPRMLEVLCQSLGWDAACFWKVDADTGNLTCLEFWHAASRSMHEFRQATLLSRLKPGEDLPGKVWATEESVWVSDVTQASGFLRASEAEAAGLRGCFACPVVIGPRFLAIIECFSAEVQLPDDDLLEMMTTVAGQLGQFMERQQAEKALRESERLYRAIGESIDYGVWVCDAEGRNVYASDSFLRLVGLTQEECSEFGWCDVLHPEDSDRARLAWQHCVQTGGQWDFEHRFRGVDGQDHPILARGVPVRDEQGRVVCWAGINLDIRQLKQTETALRESEALLRAEMESMARLHDLSTRLFQASDLGHALEEVLEAAIAITKADKGSIQLFDPRSDTLKFVAHRGFGQDFLEHFQQVSRNEGSAYSQAMTSEKRVVIADVQMEPLFEPHRQIAAAAGYRAVQSTPLLCHTSGFLGILSTYFPEPHRPSEHDERMLDLYARQAADLIQRLNSETVLRRQSQRIRLLWDAAAVLLTADDPDAMMRELFARVSDHLGVDAYFNFIVDETGEALRMVSCVGIPDDTARSIERLAFGQAVCGAVALQRRPIIATRIHESDDPAVQLVKSFGIRAYACNPLMVDDQLIGTLSFASRTKEHFDDGELSFMETLCRYVTFAYVRLRLMDQLKETDRRKDNFLATLAHELRNPLAPIRNGLHVMRLAGDNKQMVEQVREMMDRQLTQMVRLIDDLLDISRITRNKLELRRERMELGHVIQSAIETAQPLIDERRHALHVTLPSDVVPLDADPTRLAQVFANLLTNAAKYTEPGGDIWLTGEVQESSIVVSVRDNGIGVAAEHLPKLFEMFSQVAPAMERSQGGLGIGLALVHGLVEMHGGSIEARSKGPGKGSEFIVRIPQFTTSQDRTDFGGTPQEILT